MHVNTMRWTPPVEVDHYFEIERCYEDEDDEFSMAMPEPFLASKDFGTLLALMPYLSVGRHYVGLTRYSIMETRDTKSDSMEVRRYHDYSHSYGKDVRRGRFIAGWFNGEDVTQEIVEQEIAAIDQAMLDNAY